MRTGILAQLNMNPVRTIAHKRDGRALSAEEISQFIAGFAVGDVPDYQAAALAMAVYLRGMTTDETAALTEAMLASGTTLAWPAGAPVVDKHSTGGIGDKTSLPLAPLLACCGLRVPMISGRGLGPTGGTLDKLESIAGFRTDLSIDEIRSQVERVGCVITGASREIAPADRKLYALRDVTATVASIPLITASIMSKKLAEGLDALVLDVKCGTGAFMKSHEHARALARSLVDTGKRMNVATAALVTDMNQPLGWMAGNTLEVDECVTLLQGEGPEDLRGLTLALGAEALVLAGVARHTEAAEALLARELDSGRAYEKFSEMVAAQGGVLDAPREVARPRNVARSKGGYIESIDAEKLGLAIIELGGGRKRKHDKVDHAVGIDMLARIGDHVERGQPLARMFARGDCDEATLLVESAFTFSPHPIEPPALIVERID
jgi:pyrimidine-nucleoside phosphorylase